MKGDHFSDSSMQRSQSLQEGHRRPSLLEEKYQNAQEFTKRYDDYMTFKQCMRLDHRQDYIISDVILNAKNNLEIEIDNLNQLVKSKYLEDIDNHYFQEFKMELNMKEIDWYHMKLGKERASLEDFKDGDSFNISRKYLLTL